MPLTAPSQTKPTAQKRVRNGLFSAQEHGSSTNSTSAASRANGARSKGPRTIEGKRKSRLNAVRHGLLADQVLLSIEDPGSFRELFSQFLERFGPADGVELCAIEEMVSACWRQRRGWAMEARVLEEGMAGKQGSQVARLTAAFTAHSPDLHLLHRYETRLHRIFQRALYNLLLLREMVPSPQGPTQPTTCSPELPNEPSTMAGWPPRMMKMDLPRAASPPILRPVGGQRSIWD